MKITKFLAAVLSIALIGVPVWPQVGSLSPASAVAHSAAPAALSSAILLAYEGTVSVRHADGTILTKLAASLPLGQGDKLQTGANGYALVRLQDQSELRIDPDSVFSVKEESPSRVLLWLGLGKVWAAVSKRSGRLFEVETPAAVASVRGTAFSVTVPESGVAMTEVYEGAVSVQAMKDGIPVGSAKLAIPGERVEASGAALKRVESMLKNLPQTKPTAVAKEAGASEGEESPAARRFRLEYQLKGIADEMKADAADPAARETIDKALESEQTSAMEEALKTVSRKWPLPQPPEGMSFAKMQADLMGAYRKAETLEDFAKTLSPKGSAPPMVPVKTLDKRDMKKEAMKALDKWQVGREIALQMQHAAIHSVMSQGVFNSIASPAVMRVSMAAYGQQFAQNYFQARKALAGEAPSVFPSGMAAAKAPPSLVMMAPPLPSTMNQLPPTQAMPIMMQYSTVKPSYYNMYYTPSATYTPPPSTATMPSSCSCTTVAGITTCTCI
jgi:hypothetical protein